MLHCSSITLDTTADCMSEMMTCGCVQSVSLHFFTLYPTVCILNSQNFMLPYILAQYANNSIQTCHVWTVCQPKLFHTLC